MKPPSNLPYRLLSLDGGGIKALYSASVLAELEPHHPGFWAAHADWISGTSSGGILALGLAAGHSARDMARFLEEQGPQIFPQYQGLLPLGPARQVLRQLRLRGKYPPAPLRRALTELLGDRVLQDLSTEVSVAAVNLTTGERTVFTRQSHPTVALVDVALATSATPGYFPPHSIGGELFADGGLWVNSPTLSGLVCARPHFSGRNELQVLSVGTVEQPEGYRSAGAPKSLPQWIQRMLHASTYGQAALTHDAVAAFLPHLAPTTRYVRVPPPVIPFDSLGPVRMDTTHPAALALLRSCGRAAGQNLTSDPDVHAFLKGSSGA
ncbi:MAG: CBASS cGAMP-activated phospholipase [Schleiferiaceae bacterium]